jgi:hypothetical protein
VQSLKEQKNEFLTIGSQTSKNSSAMTTVETCKLLGLSHKGMKAERIERINAHTGDPQPPSEDSCTAIIATPVQLLGDVSHAVVNARGTLVDVAKRLSEFLLLRFFSLTSSLSLRPRHFFDFNIPNNTGIR